MEKIFEWKIPDDYRNFTGHDDLPEGYRVYEDNRASGGIIIEACWNGHWEANPWGTRTLVRHLLVLIDTAKNNVAVAADCEHEWVSAVNEVVKSGEICLKCNAVR